MSDVGTGIGATLLHASKRYPLTPTKIKNIYLGPNYSDREIEKGIQKSKLIYKKVPNLEEVVADLLMQDKVIGWFQGRMEFGPRALGNRSILAQATQKDINKTLNDQLDRSEFMPFAPVTLFEEKESCYFEIDKAPTASEFMTST